MGMVLRTEETSARPRQERPLAGLKICICTPDFMFFVRNGGIGTSFFHTSSWMVGQGATVDVLYANRVHGLSATELAAARQRIQSYGLGERYIFEGREPDDVINDFEPRDQTAILSYLAYLDLKDKDYDIVLFPEWRGLGYYSMFAKREGLAFQQTRLIVQAHSSSLWHALNNQQHSFGVGDIRLYHLERKSIELADAVTCPTHYLTGWMRDHAFRLPARTEILPLILDGGSPDKSSLPLRPIDELVFFGRLERRKGLVPFLQSVRRLVLTGRAEIDFSKIKITFLGKISLVDDATSIEAIDLALAGLGLSYVINPALSSADAIAYMRSRSCLAVMLSVADNSPLTVHECIENEIPFLASNSGGIPEIVAAEDHAHALVALHPREIAPRLRDILLNGQRPARSARPQADIRAAWSDFLLAEVALARAPHVAVPVTGSLSVCLTHFERPELLTKTLLGLQRQTLASFDVVIVDDGSRSKRSLDVLDEVRNGRGNPDDPSGRWRFPITVLSQENGYVGAARNKALAQIASDYVVFMDDDNYAHETQLDEFLKAITASGFDALTCIAIAFPEAEDPADLKTFIHLYLPLGAGRSVNLFQNAYGDANGIYRVAALRDIGGFTEDYGLSWEDYELLSKLETKGYKVGVIPKALFYLRHTVGSVSRRASMLPNHYRALRPSLESLPWDTFGDAMLVAISQGLAASNFSFDGNDKAAPQWRRQLIQHAEFGRASARWIIRGRLEQFDRLAVIDFIRDMWQSSAALDELRYDLVYAVDALRSRQTLVSLTTIHRETAAIVRTFVSCLDGRPDPSLLTPESAAPSVDYYYLLGIAQIAAGDVREGIASWSMMLADVNRDYLIRNPDIHRAVRGTAFVTGIHHYLKHGYEEMRPLAYCRPAFMPFAKHDLLAPNDFLPRLAHGLELAAAKGNPDELHQLTREIVECGSIFAAFHLATSLGVVSFTKETEEPRSRKALRLALKVKSRMHGSKDPAVVFNRPFDILPHAPGSPSVATTPSAKAFHRRIVS